MSGAITVIERSMNDWLKLNSPYPFEDDPRNAKMSAGEMKTPRTLPKTAFTKAIASLPPACLVMSTLEEMVVGVAHAIMILMLVHHECISSYPSARPFVNVSESPTNLPTPNPMIGNTPKLNVWMTRCALHPSAADASTLVLSDSPEMIKIKHTTPYLTEYSVLRIPPFFPSGGYAAANAIAMTNPRNYTTTSTIIPLETSTLTKSVWLCSI